MKFLNSPYLWGGKTPFGIDCSGFTQTVYKINNIRLDRDANQQANQGTLVSKKEIKSGDLAFFGETENSITHVGIMLNKKRIIHAFGKVRIDTINLKGILKSNEREITHKLLFFRTY
jgi:cell wall-associated NlpC family hydrolase